MTTLPRSGSEILAAIDRIAPLVRADAEANDRAGRIPDALLETLLKERLFRLRLPPELDGDELAPPESLAAFEKAARQDGATGWLVTIGTGGGLLAAYLDDDVRGEVFGPPEAVAFSRRSWAASGGRRTG